MLVSNTTLCATSYSLLSVLGNSMLTGPRKVITPDKKCKLIYLSQTKLKRSTYLTTDI